MPKQPIQDFWTIGWLVYHCVLKIFFQGCWNLRSQRQVIAGHPTTLDVADRKMEHGCSLKVNCGRRQSNYVDYLRHNLICLSSEADTRQHWKCRNSCKRASFCANPIQARCTFLCEGKEISVSCALVGAVVSWNRMWKHILKRVHLWVTTWTLTPMPQLMLALIALRVKKPLFEKRAFGCLRPGKNTLFIFCTRSRTGFSMTEQNKQGGSEEGTLIAH